MRRAVTVVVASVALMSLLVSCQVRQTMFTACAKAADNNPFGADSKYVLVCENGKWKPIMTLDEYVRILQKKPVTIAPVPTEPPTTTTTPTTTTIPPSTVDQEHYVSSSPVGQSVAVTCPNTDLHGQTFTAGRNGLMDRVDLLIEGLADVEVTVRTTVAGAPIGPDIGRGEFHGPGSTSQLTQVTLTSPAAVVSGTMYAVVVKSTELCRELVRLHGIPLNAYANGAHWYELPGNSWVKEADSDLWFRTYVR